MTDRELLEAAARAVGYQPYDDTEMFTDAAGDVVTFDPLNDDGDALRLAMTLNIDVQFNTDDDEQTTSVIAPSPERPGSGEGWSFTEGWRDDKGFATRRAIIHAAAAIGEWKVDAPQERAD